MARCWSASRPVARRRPTPKAQSQPSSARWASARPLCSEAATTPPNSSPPSCYRKSSVMPRRFWASRYTKPWSPWPPTLMTTISVTDAVLGTTLTVPTLTASVSVVVPPGTQPDAVLRLKQQDLPAFGEGPWGDMVLRIKMQVPERLSGPERDLYEKLRALGTELKH